MLRDASAVPLETAVSATGHGILDPKTAALYGGIRGNTPVLIVLAAGKGTRFGLAPKCAQPVNGVPLARHSIDGFRALFASPVLCVIGYRGDEVAEALGGDNVYVRSANPTGGTAFAAYEALTLDVFADEDPLVVLTMGDRIVTPTVFRKLCETHAAGRREADLTFLTAVYEPPRNLGKGRVVRDVRGRVIRIVEQRDIDALPEAAARLQLQEQTEGNCPLYAARATTLRRHLRGVSNLNAQQQYYLTDIVESIAREGGDVRTITTTVQDPEYDLLCSDVTHPMDLALLEGILRSSQSVLLPARGLDAAVRTIAVGRPRGQVASIAAQLQELLDICAWENLGYRPDLPVAIGISGGRLRIAFMHPDMGRFFGPAWQMPIGAADAAGQEQVVLLVQPADDGRILLHPTNPQFQERLNHVPADNESMYPGDEICDWYTYEGFGTRMAENLLLSLGYFTDAELEARRSTGQPLPPPDLWVRNSMRRPFSLVGNAIASLRTLRTGRLGSRVQLFLGRENFRGLRLATTGNIPRGGFSSSSAVTVAVKNALNALFDLGIPPELLVQLACQAEYGTGVRAGSLDQATEQMGQSGIGTLLSSNPRDNYRLLGTFAVPSGRYHLIFPYSVDRDRSAWQWSGGMYAAAPEPGRLTTGEMRKMTGKAAELAAILLRLPLETDFFPHVQEELLRNGALDTESQRWVFDVLRRIPALISKESLRALMLKNRPWYIEQLIEYRHLAPAEASTVADATFDNLFAGWSEPCLRRTLPDGRIVAEPGVPLRAMVAYLFAEVARNFRLIHHPEEWIACVSLSQRGDRCVEIDTSRLPSSAQLMAECDWDKGVAGPARLESWLHGCGATPTDFNRGLDDADISRDDPPPLHLLEGGNFFRGLALIDLAEAMLHRAFGDDAVAVRINAAGQGDYFQVHIDKSRAQVEEVKEFLRAAFYGRFSLAPDPEFVEISPGGGAVGIRVDRFDQLHALVRLLRAVS